MRKRILAIKLFIAMTLVMLLTSCLGDHENYQRGTNEFMYITEISGQRYAASRAGYLVHDDFNKYDLGTCLRATYKVVYENGNAVGRGYRANELQIDPQNVYPSSSQFVASQSSEYPAENTTINEAFSSIAIEYYSFNNIWGDRWLFKYSCPMTEDERENNTTSLEIYYNPDRQDDGYGNQLPEGQCVLDIVLRRDGAQTSDNKRVTDGKKVVNLSNLRRTLEGRAAEESSEVTDVKTVKFRFRYLEINPSDNNTYELRTRLLGNLGLSWAIEEEKIQ